MATESPRERADAAHHHLDPASGKAIAIAVVEGGYDSLLEGFVEILRIPSIGDAVIGMACPLADGKTIGAVKSFGPPAIQNATVQAAVENRFLTAGAGRFERPPRIIEPDVHSLDQVSADIDVVIFDEGNASGEAGIVAKIRDFLDELFARFIFRVRLSSKDHLDRSFGIAEDCRNTIEIIEQQIGSFVSCEATTKTDCQDIWA